MSRPELVRQARPVKVSDIMTREVLTVSPHATLKDVAQLLVANRVSGVPVVGVDGSVLGVVSEGDILRKEEGQRKSRIRRLTASLAEAQLKHNARDAGEAMTTPVVTIEPGAFVAEAARTMLDRGVKRLPVVHDGKLVGIVTRADLVRAFARGDDEIEREIREDVIVRSHWISPAAVQVEVHGGRVVLRGSVETPELADSVRYFVERVPGVVSVESRIRASAPVA
jgi:CBS domain-containing protein